MSCEFIFTRFAKLRGKTTSVLAVTVLPSTWHLRNSTLFTSPRSLTWISGQGTKVPRDANFTLQSECTARISGSLRKRCHILKCMISALRLSREPFCDWPMISCPPGKGVAFGVPLLPNPSWLFTRNSQTPVATLHFSNKWCQSESAKPWIDENSLKGYKGQPTY